MSQLELNYMPIATEARPRDQQDLMSFPCFSLSKKKRTDIVRFEDSKGNFIEVSPNPKFGMATVWDFDIMLYFVSYIRHLADTNKKIPKVFNVHAYDILKFCGRDTGKSQYDQLRSAMQRLGSTYVSTNIREESVLDEEIERKETYLNFTWISAFKENVKTRINHKTGKQKEITRAYEVQLPQWFVDGVVNSKLVLGINADYFQLTGGLERWLYRLARKFCGLSPNGMRYTLKHLYERSGSKSKYREFKRGIKDTIQKGNIPDYNFALYEMDGKDWLHFSEKDKSAEEFGKDFKERMASYKLIAESP
jgi:plasmid replication initiation protein